MGEWGRTSKIERPASYDPQTYVPARTEGLRQKTVTEFPMAECPKCHSPFLIYNGREARCGPAGCGAAYYLVKEPAVVTAQRQSVRQSAPSPAASAWPSLPSPAESPRAS